MVIEVLKPGLGTSIQDLPARLGHLSAGFPPSGPMDSWSFRLANLLVGNDPGAAGLEFQFLGPTLRFVDRCVIALCGADMGAKLNGSTLPLWTSVAVAAGDVLETSGARDGARTYLAVAGGLLVNPFLGSRSTFIKAGVGGHEGRTLLAGDRLATGSNSGQPNLTVRLPARPPLARTRSWTIEVTAGPHDHWLDGGGRSAFLESQWKLSSKSDRTGFRLEGPPLGFADFAIDKPPENGSHPSNIIDYGYPIGGINLAGQTPIVLVNDALTMGGFICPYTVPSAAFWKLAHARPGDLIQFRPIGLEAAQALRRSIDAVCTPANIVRAGD